MTQTQITLFQLDNYGPWTVTPEPRREPDLQSLQASLYADICDFVGAYDGYAFFTRFDNMIAVTNGMVREEHARLQDSLGNRYPVSVSAAIGSNADPSTALADASERLQDAGSAQDDTRRNVLAGEALAESDRSPRDVCIAHFDIVDATGKFTDTLDAFESFIGVDRTYAALAEHLYQEYGSLAFFVGGDNAIAVCRQLSKDRFRAVLQHVRDETGVELQVGVGTGRTAVAAGQTAKEALETCRAQERRLVYGDEPPRDQVGSATSST